MTHEAPPVTDLPLFAPPEKPRNPFDGPHGDYPGSQNWRILEHLIENGSILNVEAYGPPMNVKNATGRISDIRRALQGTGWALKSTAVAPKIVKHELVRE